MKKFILLSPLFSLLNILAIASTFIVFLVITLACGAASKLIEARIQDAYQLSCGWGEVSTSVLFGVALGLTYLSQRR